MVHDNSSTSSSLSPNGSFPVLQRSTTCLNLIAMTLTPNRLNVVVMSVAKPLSVLYLTLGRAGWLLTSCAVNPSSSVWSGLVAIRFAIPLQILKATACSLVGMAMSSSSSGSMW